MKEEEESARKYLFMECFATQKDEQSIIQKARRLLKSNAFDIIFSYLMMNSNSENFERTLQIIYKRQLWQSFKTVF